MKQVVESLNTLFQVRYSETNLYNRLKLSNLFLYMQDVAAKHAAQYHFGFDDLAVHDVFWVLSRVWIKVDRLPETDETINIITWPRGTDKLFALRDFKIYDDNTNEIGNATTSWLIVNKESFRPQKPVLLDDLVYPDIEPALTENAQKVNTPDDIVHSYQHTARFSDLDVNNHVNNSRYVDWLLDALTNNENNFKGCEFLINFNSQISQGDKLDIYYHQNNDSEFYLEGKSNNRSVVNAYLKSGK